RQPLRQWVGPEQHPEDPPGPEPPGVAGADRRDGECVSGFGETLRYALAVALPPEDAVEARLGPVLEIALDLLPGGGEPSPAVHVDHPTHVPGRLRTGGIAGPERLRVGMFLWVTHGDPPVLISPASGPAAFRPAPCTRRPPERYPPG